MIIYTKGDLLEDKAEVLVNTVNTEGFMGKGIALAFKNAFPHNFNVYRTECLGGDLQVGKILVVADSNLLYGDKLIVNFPTKKQWRLPSEYSYIESGLTALTAWLSANEVASIAIPALGCGNGKLNWKIVKGIIEKHLGELEIEVRVYEP